MLSTTAHSSIIRARQSKVPRLPPFEHPLERSPAQQPRRPKYEAPNDDLVLVAVALEAHGDNIVLLGILAETDALTQAKRLCALGAR